MRKQRSRQNKSTNCAASVFADHVIEVSCQERLYMKFGKSRRETQARKPLENEKYETWFHVEKTRLHMAAVSLLIAKTAMSIRILNYCCLNLL